MAQSLNQNFRYKVLDRCFRDRTRVYHRKDLIDAIEQEFKEMGIFRRRPSVRTIDYDIDNLKSGKIGVEAPITWTEERGYHYSDPHFSLYKVTLQSNIIRDLTHALSILKQIAGDSNFSNIAGSIRTLEADLQLRIDKFPGQIIHLEKSTNTMGIRWMTQLYDMILKKKTLLIDYMPFDDDLLILKVSPYRLFEYNNRWYLIGWDNDNKRVISLGLDRIQAVNQSIMPYIERPDFDMETYTADLYGVTRWEGSVPERIIFKATALQSRYILTKPIHHSQTVVKEEDDGTTFGLYLIINYEIKSRLLSFGSSIEILQPETLRTFFSEEAAAIGKLYR